MAEADKKLDNPLSYIISECDSRLIDMSSGGIRMYSVKKSFLVDLLEDIIFEYKFDCGDNLDLLAHLKFKNHHHCICFINNEFFRERALLGLNPNKQPNFSDKRIEYWDVGLFTPSDFGKRMEYYLRFERRFKSYYEPEPILLAGVHNSIEDVSEYDLDRILETPTEKLLENLNVDADEFRKGQSFEKSLQILFKDLGMRVS